MEQFSSLVPSLVLGPLSTEGRSIERNTQRKRMYAGIVKEDIDGRTTTLLQSTTAGMLKTIEYWTTAGMPKDLKEH
eukprot:2485722-Amphidinium_carterae.1